MTKIKRVPASTKFQLRIDRVCFIATARQIRAGVGTDYATNAATQKALDALEFMRSGNGAKPSGLAGHWEGLNVQLDIVAKN